MRKMIFWLSEKKFFSFFNGNNFEYPFSPFRTFAAAGAIEVLSDFEKDPFQALQLFRNKRQDWLIGRLNYDIKNYIEKLESGNPDNIPSSDLAFFIPETLIFPDLEKIVIQTTGNPNEILNEINSTEIRETEPVIKDLRCDTGKSHYMQNVENIKKQIINGDFYELNYCMCFSSSNAYIDPADIYLRLNTISPMPFSVFQGFGDHIIISASPERFLKKEKDHIIVQPMKGTSRRDPDPVMDRKLMLELKNSEKERAENLMIVDLVRNDLGKSAIPGSVNVEELFGIYSFNHVHQMISTVSCRKKDNINTFDVIKNAFPMGSMTGAPKIRAMQEIDRYENSKRGMFSGTAGFLDPEGDCDFNVLIRSIFYDRRKHILKYHVGSAITYDSDPEYEYDECLLKAKAINQTIGIG